MPDREEEKKLNRMKALLRGLVRKVCQAGSFQSLPPAEALSILRTSNKLPLLPLTGSGWPTVCLSKSTEVLTPLDDSCEVS